MAKDRSMRASFHTNSYDDTSIHDDQKIYLNELCVVQYDYLESNVVGLLYKMPQCAFRLLQ